MRVPLFWGYTSRWSMKRISMIHKSWYLPITGLNCVNGSKNKHFYKKFAICSVKKEFKVFLIDI